MAPRSLTITRQRQRSVYLFTVLSLYVASFAIRTSSSSFASDRRSFASYASSHEAGKIRGDVARDRESSRRSSRELRANARSRVVPLLSSGERYDNNEEDVEALLELAIRAVKMSGRSYPERGGEVRESDGENVRPECDVAYRRHVEETCERERVSCRETTTNADESSFLLQIGEAEQRNDVDVMDDIQGMLTNMVATVGGRHERVSRTSASGKRKSKESDVSNAESTTVAEVDEETNESDETAAVDEEQEATEESEESTIDISSKKMSDAEKDVETSDVTNEGDQDQEDDVGIETPRDDDALSEISIDLSKVDVAEESNDEDGMGVNVAYPELDPELKSFDSTLDDGVRT